MTLDPAVFRSILGRFATGVSIVTARDATETDHGMTVSAFSSLSLDPPLVLACIDRTTEMYGVLMDATHFTVNILAEEQESLSRRFAEQMTDRFDGVGFTRSSTGAAILDDVIAFAECEITSRSDAGDHTIFVGRVLSGESRAGRPLLYYRGGYAQLER
ncbi:MAG: flavin reductase family protein [Gemmatimonadaceae bacterium]